VVVQKGWRRGGRKWFIWLDRNRVAALAGVYWELRKMNRKFIISHSVTGTILYYPRPLLRRNPFKRQGF
jgi:hypothetical protein